MRSSWKHIGRGWGQKRIIVFALTLGNWQLLWPLFVLLLTAFSQFVSSRYPRISQYFAKVCKFVPVMVSEPNFPRIVHCLFTSCSLVLVYKHKHKWAAWDHHWSDSGCFSTTGLNGMNWKETNDLVLVFKKGRAGGKEGEGDNNAYVFDATMQFFWENLKEYQNIPSHIQLVQSLICSRDLVYGKLYLKE